MQRVAVISLHTSPLTQPGSGDSGGMNVYVRELVSSLAQAGVECTTFTRADRPDVPEVVQIEPNHRVVHVHAGPYDLRKEELPSVIDEFTAGVRRHLDGEFPADVLHANYWLSGEVAHRLKHERDLPFAITFHTLARVKAEGGDPEPDWRVEAEDRIIGCADAISVNCDEEERQFRRLYGDPPGRIEVVAPAVEHAFFAPGDRRGARRALGVAADRPMVLFVGRIQPLKGPDVAVRALAAMRRTDAQLLVVGGASGADGTREVGHLEHLIDELGVRDRVRFVPPQPHHILSTYYRAADAVVVPSRSESFGLVALEAAACGVPVVASAVGGLLSLVDHAHTGYLVADRDPDCFAAHLDHLVEHPLAAAAMGHRAHERSLHYTWGMAAVRLRRLYADLTVRELVACR
ncbi:MAG: glycosyltransferase [Acidimicrobiales bacterium]|nr:glycosyltransferase [Acidimicrobiales bacterium]MCB9392641.1 glycosyltransferase [Acidimicrobiaceae bacterium]